MRKRIRQEEEDSLFLDFDVDELAEHAVKLQKAIQRLFTRSVPRYKSMTRDIMDLAKGISNYDEYVRIVRLCIFNMNNAFIDLFKTLNQPYDLELNEDGSIAKEPAPIPPPKPPQPTNAKALSARSPRRINQ